MKKEKARLLRVIGPFLLVFLYPIISPAEQQIEVIPRISWSEVYDDNIYLDNTNEKTDYITTISPGLNLTISSINKDLSIDYAPTWVWYHKYDQNNTVRQAAALAFNQNVAEHVSLELADTYIRTEEPLEVDEEVEITRTTRNVYQQNSASASLGYQFGQEDNLFIGYRNYLLENEDPTIDDGTIQSIFGNFNYWLNLNSGFEFGYEYTNANFWRDDETPSGDDYDGNAASLGYIYRFTPNTSCSLAYGFTNRNFEGLEEDYQVHEETIGVDHSFSPNLSLSLQGGIFILVNEKSDNETGYSFNALLEKSFERGGFTIGGQGGWDEIYLEEERRGLIRYWSTNSRVEYQLMESLNSYVIGSFRREIDSYDQERKIWSGSGGLRFEFLRWLSLALAYSYRDQDDDDDDLDYIDNRVMLTLTASKPYRWY